MPDFLMLTSKRTLVGAALAASALVAASVACSDDDSPGSIDDGAPGPSFSAPDARSGGEAGGALVATMRIAHLAPSLGPIDFCYQGARVGSFEGPVVRGPKVPVAADAASGDAGSEPDAKSVDAGIPEASIDYGSVSRYLSLAGTGTLTIAIVESGSMSCASPMATGDVTLDPGKLSTVVLLEGKLPDGGVDVSPSFSLVALTDDPTTVEDKARVRVFHAALRAGVPAITVRAVSGQTTLLAERVQPRAASAPSQTVPVDALGYATVAPVPPPAVIAVAPAVPDASDSFRTWVSEPLELELRAGSLHTAFVVKGDNEDSSDFEVIWCADRTTIGDHTACRRVR